ncbi:MAG: hypothetical protein ACRELY_02750 [Polyangiaceae bacterium]
MREVAPPPPTGMSSAPPAPIVERSDASAKSETTSAELRSPPQATVSKGSRRTLFVVLGSAVALLAVGAAAWAFFPTKRHPLPIVAEKLPTKTTRIVERRLNAGVDAVMMHDEYLAAQFAQIACGGEDIVADISLLRNASLPSLIATGRIGIATSDPIRKALKCGDAIRKSVTDPTVVQVDFDDADKKLQVIAVRSSLPQLPPELGFVRHTFSGLEGACLKGEPDKTECADGTAAGFHDDKQTWFFGKAEAVSAFARDYTTSHTELSTGVETLAKTIDQTDDANEIDLRAKPEIIAWPLPCLLAAPLEHEADFSKACFPSDQDRVLEAIVSKVRGVAVEQELPTSGDLFRFQYVLLARDADSAKSLESDVSDLARDWRAQVGNGQADMDRLIRAKSE